MSTSPADGSVSTNLVDGSVSVSTNLVDSSVFTDQVDSIPH